MLRFATVARHPAVFEALTGLSLAAFQALLPAFVHAELALQAQEDATRSQPRQRQRGGGAKARLTRPEERLLFILVYFKLYPIQAVQGFLFGLSQAQAWTWIHRLTPVLNVALGTEQQLPNRQPARLNHVLRQCRGLEFILDGTERPIQRPQDTPRQRSCYSGKKKHHTVKNVVIVHRRTKRIVHLSRTRPGSTHDKRIADEEDYHFPAGATVWQDTGFQGYAPPKVTIQQPKKKPPKRALTDDEKARNQAISRVRVRVEHAIGGAKAFHIVRDIYRNHRPDYEDLIMETACGLHNLRLCYPFRRAA